MATKSARKSKIDDLGAPKPSPLADAARNIIRRIENDEMPWQNHNVHMMPTNVSGRQISNINFLTLVGAGEDSRWGTFPDIQNIGGFVNKDESAKVSIIHWWTSRQKVEEGTEEVVKKFSRAVPVKLFNLAQATHTLPKIEIPDTLASALTLKILSANAGVHLVFDENDKDIYVENTINVDMDNIDEEVVGTLIHGLVAWSREQGSLNKPADESLRSTLIDTVAVSMLCAEYGVPVPGFIASKMESVKNATVAYLNEHLDDVLRISRESWEVRQFINQFSPTNTVEDTAENAGDTALDIQNEQDAATKPGRHLFR